MIKMYWAISLLKTRKPGDNGSDLLKPKNWENLIVNSIFQEPGPAEASLQISRSFIL